LRPRGRGARAPLPRRLGLPPQFAGQRAVELGHRAGGTRQLPPVRTLAAVRATPAWRTGTAGLPPSHRPGPDPARGAGAGGPARWHGGDGGSGLAGLARPWPGATRGAARRRWHAAAAHGHPHPGPAARAAIGCAAPPLRPGAAGAPAEALWRGGRSAGVLPAAGAFRRTRRAGLRGRDPYRAAVPAAAPGRRPVHLPVDPRRRRAAFRAAAGTRAGPYRRGSGPAGAGAQRIHAVRAGARAPGAGGDRAPGGGHAPAGAAPAAVRAGDAGPVRATFAAGAGLAAAARAP